jgi:GNAT superfamily N-acetyltransferase
MPNYEVVPYQPALKRDLVELRRQVWDSVAETSRRYLEWKYEQNPYSQGPIYYIAVCNGEVVGMRGVYGSRWQVGDTSVDLPVTDDLIVAEDFRHLGVARTIIRASQRDLAERGFEYALSLSAGRITTGALLAIGWRPACSFEPVARFDSRRHTLRTLRKFAARRRLIWRIGTYPERATASTKPFARLDDAGAKRNGHSGAHITVEREPRPDAMAELVDRLGYDGRIRHVRDAAFFAWRYQNPTREYRFVYCDSNGHLDGYLVLARSISYDPPTLPFHIVDWEATTVGIRSLLAEKALAWGRFDEIGTWSSALPPDGDTVLTRLGFRPTNGHSPSNGTASVLIGSLNADTDWTLHGRNLADPKQWDLRRIYSMHG